jgi:hypothetical protein
MRSNRRRNILTVLSVLALGLSAGTASATYNPPPKIGEAQDPFQKSYDYKNSTEGICWMVGCQMRDTFCCTVDKAD